MLIEALLLMYSQIPFANSIRGKVADTKIYDFRPLEFKIDEIIAKSPPSNKRIYIKLITLEPIDICFTFRNSPGYKMNLAANSILTDFGLVLASIDSAKIRLNSFKTEHIFGLKDEIISRITGHYKKKVTYNRNIKIINCYKFCELNRGSSFALLNIFLIFNSQIK